eukprot:709818-Heterocapsa_arctica.AAC.1
MLGSYPSAVGYRVRSGRSSTRDHEDGLTRWTRSPLGTVQARDGSYHEPPRTPIHLSPAVGAKAV